MKKYRSAVSVLVVRGKEFEILLVHKPRRHDAWQLPQGGVEEGESLEEAALRELREETGLSPGLVRHVSTQTYCYDFPPAYVRRYHPFNDGQRLRFIVVEVPADSEVKVDNREVDSFVWVTEDKLPQYIERVEYLGIVLSVLEEFKEPRVKN